ncbi:MAG: serine/threonine-protein kinase [Pirellulales bacterium]
MTALQLDEEQLFKQAMQISSPRERASFLQQACPGDEALRERVAALLDAAGESSSFLEKSPLDGSPLVSSPHDDRVIRQAATRADPVISERPGMRIGSYKLLEQIGEGGFGVVFVAEQQQPIRRLVALKVLKPGMESRQVIARFEAERQALAMMDHPHIAQVWDAGTTEHGRPYFVMELVRGIPITQFCDQRRLSPRQRLELFVPVCQAIQHAHQKGIIHRDIKPSNVLVALYDDRPSPKVIDFGIAKAAGLALTDMTLVTKFGALVGTLEYMSPEQASLNQLDVDTRSDVYSLGVLLYELLTGVTPLGREPFERGAILEALRIVREVETPVPSVRLSTESALPSIAANRGMAPEKLPLMIRGELDWVLLKALEKDRSRRYETASAMARDIERYLADELVEARPPSTAYRVRKFIHQHRRAAASALFAAICLILGTTFSVGQAVRATRAETEAKAQAHHAAFAQMSTLVEQTRAVEAMQVAMAEGEEAKLQRAEAERQRIVAQNETAKARYHLVSSQLLLGRIAQSEGDIAGALTWFLQSYLNAMPDDPRRVSARNLLGAWENPLRQTLVHDRGVHTLAVSAEGKRLLAGYFNSRAQLWDLGTGLPLGDPLPHAGDIVSAQFHSQGDWVLIGDWEGAKVWDLATGKLKYPALEHEVREDTVVGPVLSPDGRTIVTRAPLTSLRLWDAETGQPRGEPLSLDKLIDRIYFSRDSKWVVAWGEESARVWNVEKALPLGGRFDDVADVAFHPEGRVMSTVLNEKSIQLTELETGKLLAELTHDQPVLGITFDKEGRRLAARDRENVIVWTDVMSDQRVRRVFPHGRNLFSATFSPSPTGELLAASPGLVRVWKEKSELPAWERSTPITLGQRSLFWKSATWAPDGLSVLIMTQNGTAELLSVEKGISLIKDVNVLSARFSADGQSVYFGKSDGLVRDYVVKTKDHRRLPRAPLPADLGRIETVAVSPDGKLVFVAGDKGARLLQANSWTPVGELLADIGMVRQAAFSSDSRTLAISSLYSEKGGKSPRSERLTFWNTMNAERLGAPMPIATNSVTLAFEVGDKNVLVGRSLISLQNRTPYQYVAEDLPAGQRAIMELLGSVNSPTPLLWNHERNLPTTVAVTAVAPSQALLSPDGSHLLIVSADGQAQVFNAATGKPSGPTFQPHGTATERSRDGRFTLFGDLSTLRLWDAWTGRPCGEALQKEQALASATFGRDGSIVATRWRFESHLWDSATGLMLGPPMQLSSNQIAKPVFSADGRQLFIPSGGLEVWQIPAALADAPERVRLAIEVRTGLEVSDQSSLQRISRAAWLERKKKLNP